MGRPLQIDRASILESAFRIADEEGLSAVTMQRVASRLEVTPMALYRHVADKADLLDGLVELLLADVAVAADADTGPGSGADTMPWRDRLQWMAHALREIAQDHPAVFALLFQRPARTAALQAREAVIGSLREAGVPDADLARTERVISTVVLGFAASEAGGRFIERRLDEIDADFEAALAMVECYIGSLCPVRTD